MTFCLPVVYLKIDIYRSWAPRFRTLAKVDWPASRVTSVSQGTNVSIEDLQSYNLEKLSRRMLLDLPTELQLMITGHLSLQDAIKLARTSQDSFQRLIVPLYRREPSKLIAWAARAGHERTLLIALKA